MILYEEYLTLVI